MFEDHYNDVAEHRAKSLRTMPGMSDRGVAIVIDRKNPLIREVTSLPPLVKLQLVDYLLESLDMPDTEIEKLWAEESSRRWNGYKAGEIGSPLYWQGR